METTTEQTPKLAAALAKAQGAFLPILKNRTVKVTTKDKTTGKPNGSYTFTYATFDAIIAATKDALSANGLAQSALVADGRITVTLLHESGESRSSWLPLPDPAEVGWQAFGSAESYARRYLWGPMIGVASEEDDDGNIVDGNTFCDPLQSLWDALESAGIMAKGKDAVRAWCEQVLGRPIPTSDALKETDIPLLIGTAQGKLPMPAPKTPEAKPTDSPKASPLAKALNEALDKLAPWGPLDPNLDKAGQAMAKKAAKLAWINGMLPSGQHINALGELPDTEIQRLTAAAKNGEMPNEDAEPAWMDQYTKGTPEQS